jgi:serine/threonine-protein kinase RsbT
VDTALDEAVITINSSEDIVAARQKVRASAVRLGFSVINQTKLITAASELARNTLDYGGGGRMRIMELRNGIKAGLKLIFEDEGPGIPDIRQAMQDGWTSGGGLGLGLSGAKRLSHEFEIQSEAGKGTRVSIVQWK